MTTDLQPHAGIAPTGVPHGLPPLPGSHPQPTVADVLRIFRRRLWVIVLILAVAIATAIYVTRKTPPTWQAHAQMILVPPTPVVTGDGSSPAAAPEQSVETQMTMIQDQEMTRRALTQLTSSGHSPDQIGVNAIQLGQAIDVENPKDTNLIDLFVKADNPDQAALLADGVCQAFIAWKKEIAQSNSEEAMTNLEVRANRAKVELNAAEQAELKFRQSHQIVDASVQSSALLNQSTAAESQVESLDQELYTDKAHLKALGQRLKNVDQAIRNGTGVRDDSLVMGLQSQLSGLEVQRAQAALRYTAKFPGILPNLDAQIKDIQKRLTKAVQGTLNNKRPSLQAQDALYQNYEQAQTEVLLTQAKLTAAQKLQAQLQAQTKQLPLRNLADERLQSTVALDRQLYMSLQSALNAARLEKDDATSDVQLVQAADVDPKPVDPNPIRNLAVGGAVGIVLALAAVMLLEQADRRVRDMDGLRALTDGPIIGALPQMSRAQIAALREGRPSLPAAEAYNMASANLSLTMRWAAPMDQWDHRVVLITSALPGEGKSVTSAALARSLAQTGKKVVLVNADLRRPSLDDLFPTEETVGLADVLEDKTDVESALQPTELYNLRVLHSGSATRNPTELISRPQMLRTLQDLKATNDIVLIDTPACSVVADALLLAPHADCVLYVVGAGQVDQDTVRTATASLSAAAPRTLAYVINRTARQRRYGYHQYYHQQNFAEDAAASSEALPAPTTELARSVQIIPAAAPQDKTDDAPNDVTSMDHQEL